MGANKRLINVKYVLLILFLGLFSKKDANKGSSRMSVPWGETWGLLINKHAGQRVFRWWIRQGSSAADCNVFFGIRGEVYVFRRFGV